jgi:UDP-N-acetylenolpyruvoylglucosamine reductase
MKNFFCNNVARSNFSLPEVSTPTLIERAGMNGITRGGAAVLADCIVNANDAKAFDILALITHVHLEMDLQLVGFEEETLAKVA